MTLPAEWVEWSRQAAERDARVRGIGLALHRRIRELDSDCGACFAAVRTLAAAVGCDRRTVQRWLRRLEAWGYVLRIDRSWESGMRRSHVLVPVAPPSTDGRDQSAALALVRRATETATRFAASWRPTRWLRSRAPMDTPPRKQVVSRGGTAKPRAARKSRKQWRSAVNEALFAALGFRRDASGALVRDPGWQHEATT